MSTGRKPYPSDVTDAEWEFLLPYLSLMREDAPQREYVLRDVFDALRYVVRTGCQWDFLPHDFPPWTAVYQQARQWVAAGVFEEITHDLRMILRMVEEREAQPHAEAIMRGVKTVEYRSGPTNVRGRVLIYAGLGRYSASDEAEMM